VDSYQSGTSGGAGLGSTTAASAQKPYISPTKVNAVVDGVANTHFLPRSCILLEKITPCSQVGIHVPKALDGFLAQFSREKDVDLFG
jgi:hypothetical protein